jgi:group II intron reverse transcriptase/maturase
MTVTEVEFEGRYLGRGLAWKSSTECERYEQLLIDGWITENNTADANKQESGLLEKIAAWKNLNRAIRKVKGNKGAGGVDGMSVGDLDAYFREHGEEIRQAILGGKYSPDPVRRVEIPKDDGVKRRKLGIPTAVDRVIQQAIAQVLMPIYEPKFVETSYGFRPERGAHDAIRKCLEYANAGYKFAVDIDLEKFFDTVNQSKLIQILSEDIKDGRVISLIHKYLRAGVMVSGKFEETELGVPQGGPLSPLCANIVLNEMDHELERRGHRFVRYADDMVILCKSLRSARRTLDHLIPYIEGVLFLRLNREKTVVALINRIKFLGFGFYWNKGKCRVRVHPKSVAKMKAKLKLLTKRNDGCGYERKKEKLKLYVRGWINYFCIADMKQLLLRTDEWMRRRIRSYIWKQWKRIKTRFKNLRKLGVSKSNAGILANSRKGYWRIAGSPILQAAITNDRLKRAGYPCLSDYYLKCHA